MKFKKKGAIEVQFNWMFVLIAGAIILLFFGTIMIKQKTASEQKIAASLLVDLESIITGSIVSKQALNFISIPNIEINFEGCDFYYIGKKKEAGTKLKRDIKEKVIFTPDMIKGTRLTIWSLPWDIPYRVTNFLYLTSPQVRYIIVYDDGIPADLALADAIEELLPPETLTIDNEEYTVMFRQHNPALSDLNNYKVKFVFLNTEPSGDLTVFSEMEESDVRAIKIEGIIESGAIRFYRKFGGGWSFLEQFEYYGKAALIGAIFAEDRDMYECAMQNAFQRMRVVTGVYVNRTIKIRDGGFVSPTCQTHYDNILPNLFSIRDVSGIFNDIINEIRNNQLPAQDKNCPLVY